MFVWQEKTHHRSLSSLTRINVYILVLRQIPEVLWMETGSWVQQLPWTIVLTLWPHVSDPVTFYSVCFFWIICSCPLRFDRGMELCGVKVIAIKGFRSWPFAILKGLRFDFFIFCSWKKYLQMSLKTNCTLDRLDILIWKIVFWSNRNNLSPNPQPTK